MLEEPPVAPKPLLTPSAKLERTLCAARRSGEAAAPPAAIRRMHPTEAPTLSPEAVLELARLEGYTHLDADTAAQRPAPGVVPYEINAPRFLDHATSERWVAFPGAGKITIAAQPLLTFMQPVKAGSPMFEVHYRGQADAAGPVRLLQTCYTITQRQRPQPPLVLETLS